MKQLALWIVFTLTFFIVAFSTVLIISDGSTIFFVEAPYWALLVSFFFLAHIVTQFMPGYDISKPVSHVLALASGLYIPLLILVFALAYRHFGISGADSKGDYLYFSIVTFTTLGYGDMSPIGPARYFANIQALSGFLFVPLIVSQVIRITEKLQANGPHGR
ncbi:MAG: potassium channel family protein [Maricaulis sp.]|uniref:potassium channel family protein n=1 Tax=Maricaulis sp. TaxID=1486257 RepID=UPI00261F054B|nr:potassium channel family protein [Maricaulis sp.]MDM7983263.1 potassium channel family protein [Maricaulis sp.]